MSLNMIFSPERAAVVWATLERISGFDPSLEMIAPRYLKFSTSSSLRPFILISLWKHNPRMLHLYRFISCEISSTLPAALRVLTSYVAMVMSSLPLSLAPICVYARRIIVFLSACVNMN